MSKLFSVSLATILMLMSLMGPAQPVTFQDDASPDTNPVLEEIPSSEPQDGDEAIEVKEPSVPEPLEEVPLPQEGPQEIAPVDAPEENANAPPADEVEDTAEVEVSAPVDTDEPIETEAPAPTADESVVDADESASSDSDIVEVEEAPVKTNALVVESVSTDDENTTNETDSLVISPNAVDPMPGDCPVGEICDGGGGGDNPEPQMVDITFRVMGNSTSGNAPLPNATVTIYLGSTHVLTQQTSTQGTVSLQMQVHQSYRVTATATGYTSLVGREVFPFRDATIDLQLQEAPAQVGTVTIKVINSRTGNPVEGATVNIVQDRTWNHMGTGTSADDGTWTTQELPHGDYEVTVYHEVEDYHSASDIKVTVPVSGTVDVQLNPFDRSPISLKVIDANTGEPVDGAFFYLWKDNNGSDVEDFTPANGEYVTEPLEHGNYGITVSADGYGRVIDLRWDHPHTGIFVIELQPFADGTITIIALDDETREPIANASITLYEGDFDREVMVGTTDTDGTWTSPELPGGFYTATIYPAEHYVRYPDMSVVSGNSTYEILFTRFNDVGWMDVKVTDTTGRFNVAHAKITVREEGLGIITTGTTDSNGYWRLPYLPSGSYEFTVERTGFVTKTVQLQKSSADTTLNVELSRSGLHSIRFWLVYPTCCSDGDDSDGNVLRPVVPGLSTTYGLMPMAFQPVDGTQPVVGAHAMLIDPMNRQVIVMKSSDSNGLVDLGTVYGGTYILQIYGGPFEEYTQVIHLDSDLELTFAVGPADEDSGTDNPGDGTDPGTGNPGEGTDPGTGNPDDGTDPGTGNPDDGTDPGTGNPDDGTNPGTGNPGEGTSPGTSNPDNGSVTNPGTDSPVDSSNPGAGSEPGQSIDDIAGETGSAGSGGTTDSEAVAQSSDTASDASSARVSELPNTGSGEHGSGVTIAAITLVAAFTLLSALGIRRKA